MRTTRIAVLAALLALLGAVPAAAAPAAPPPTAQTVTSIPTVGPLFVPSVVGLGPVLGLPHFCSASVVHSATRDLVLTAAHCVFGTGLGFEFAPGYHDGISPYGVWTVERVYVDPAWTATQDPQHDVAVLEVAPRSGRRIEDRTGAATLAPAPAAGNRRHRRRVRRRLGRTADHLHGAGLLHGRLSQLRLRGLCLRGQWRPLADRRPRGRGDRRIAPGRLHRLHVLQLRVRPPRSRRCSSAPRTAARATWRHCPAVTAAESALASRA